jgi:hypothetical protein
MIMEIKIPEYDVKKGFEHHWEDGFEIKVVRSDNGVVLSANKAGLVSLAIQLLTLAQDSVPSNYNYHLDEHNSLEEGSIELVIERIP